MPMHERALAAGTTIYSEGDPGDAVYFIRSGQVEILKRAGDTPVKLVTLGKGEVLGEMSVIRDEPRSTTARALTETALMVLTKEDFLAAFGGKNGVALGILRMLCERLAKADQQLLADSKPDTRPDGPTALLSEVAAIRIGSSSELVRWQIGDGTLAVEALPFRVGCHRQGDKAVKQAKDALSLLAANDHQLSRQHFAIEKRGGELIVRDLGSHLGTMVNGQRISRFDSEAVAGLRLGANQVVAGGAESPYRFVVYVDAGEPKKPL